MTIMATRMHHAIFAGGMRETSRLPDGKRIHIGTKSDPAVMTTLSMNDTDDARASDTGLHLVDTKGPEHFSHLRGGSLLLETEFGMCVKVSKDLHQLRGIALNVVDHRHVGLRSND